MAPLDFREVKLFVDGERVKQLLVVSLAAERFWWLALHERRGMNAFVDTHLIIQRQFTPYTVI
jgi:uncharacterized protein YktB (UPF0637 family)